MIMTSYIAANYLVLTSHSIHSREWWIILFLILKKVVTAWEVERSNPTDRY
jgi:hypothetical protein